MRPVVAPLVVAVVAAVVVGCGGDDAGSTDVSSLEGVPWVLTAGIDVEGWEEFAPSATFEAGRVTGSTGCNSYSGPYTVDGETLELGMLTQTLIGCQPPASEVETTFVAALQEVVGWRIDGEELVLLDSDDEELLRFEVGTPIGSWEATGILRGDAFASPIAGTEITATFSDEDELSGSAGCNTYTATFTIDGGAIEITPPAATRKLCKGPAGVMQQESAYFEALASATGYRIDGKTLQLSSADGTRVVDFTRATG